jgi:hypothetical protein
VPRETVAEEHDSGGGTYRLEMVYCGRPACKSCPHGPYWYRYYRTGGKRGGRVISKYVGRDRAGATTRRRGSSGADVADSTALTTAAPAAEPVGPAPVSGQMSARPLTPNKWGVPAPGHPVSFHGDNPIGTAIRSMGKEAHLDVDGEPLADVLGKIATDAGHCVITAQEALDRVKQLRDRLPVGGSARYALDAAIRRELDAPDTPTPAVPDGAPESLRRLMAQLHAVPAVRRDPDGEDQMLARVLADHAVGGHAMLLRRAVGQLRNRRHESTLGWREINDAVRQAEEDLLKAPRRQEREAAPRPPSQPGPAPAPKRKGIWAATDERADAAMPAAWAAASALRAAPTADRVRAAYDALADGPGAYVRIADIRRALPDVPRSQLDHALSGMYQTQRANLVSQADQENLTAEDRQSSLHIGGMDKHRITIERDSAP